MAPKAILDFLTILCYIKHIDLSPTIERTDMDDAATNTTIALGEAIKEELRPKIRDHYLDPAESDAPFFDLPALKAMKGHDYEHTIHELKQLDFYVGAALRNKQPKTPEDLDTPTVTPAWMLVVDHRNDLLYALYLEHGSGWAASLANELVGRSLTNKPSWDTMCPQYVNGTLPGSLHGFFTALGLIGEYEDALAHELERNPFLNRS